MAEILQNKQQWEVTGDIFMNNANALLEASNALTISDGTAINFKNVDEVDTAAVSLMLAWRRRANAEQHVLKFVNLPASLTSLLGLYGIAGLFN